MAGQVEISYVALQATQAYAPQVVISYVALQSTPPVNTSMGISRMTLVGGVLKWVPQTAKRMVSGSWT